LSHSTKDPISLVKGIIGHKNPEEAKKTNPNSLRAKYGKDIVRNEFYSSDDLLGANKDRDIFRFPIPQKEPDLAMDKNKIGLDVLWSFLHPKNLEHSNVNGRLDVFAIYGPVTKRFPINWFSKPTQKLMKKYLLRVRADKTQKEKERLGLLSSTTEGSQVGTQNNIVWQGRQEGILAS